jgi:hypothetical protein
MSDAGAPKVSVGGSFTAALEYRGFWRGVPRNQKNTAKAIINNRTQPTTIPPIAPPEIEDDDAEAVELEVADVGLGMN